MWYKSVPLIPCIFLASCQSPQQQSGNLPNISPTGAPCNINPHANIGAIPVPKGFTRTVNNEDGFAGWLRAVALKTDQTVYLFNGTKKENQSAQFAVLDVSTGTSDLQQCADAVMRLRAEFLFARERFGDIRFTDNEGTTYAFSAPFTRNHFDQYLKTVFGMCGSASLSKQLHSKPLSTIQPGDVLIRGGFPGHTVMVMDVAKDPVGNTVYLIAQSYMPAQDIHLLKNPTDAQLSPWYRVTNETLIETPEYIFHNNELKGW